MQYLTIWDVILTPLYLIALSYIAKRYRDKHYPRGHALRKYYLPGLYVKFGGAIFIALVYQYYYGGGDTFNYFRHSQIINSSLDDSVTTWFDLLLRRSASINPEVYPYASQMEWYEDAPSYSVAVFGAIFGLLNGTSYLPIALLFAYFSFTGVWAMYRTFVNIYPRLYKELAIAFLFIPSTFVWGSAMFKDTVCMFGLGWMVYTTFRIFINGDFSVKNLVMLAFSFYLVAHIKIYILLAFIPALGLWLLMTYSKRIGSAVLRWGLNLFFVGLISLGFIFFTQLFANDLNRYSLEKIAKTAESTRGWIAYASGDEGSSYDLGAFPPTIEGMLSKFPAAIAVTFYRPFLWESRKVIVALSALEALFFVFFTLKLIYKQKLATLKHLSKDPNLIFLLIFALIFAFAVGISSYNFGALSRYKIPCLPFFGAFLIIALNYTKTTATTIQTHLKRPVNKRAFA